MKDINNLQKHVQDERKAVLYKDPGPRDSIDYSQLRGKLEASWRTIYDPNLKATVTLDEYREIENLRGRSCLGLSR